MQEIAKPRKALVVIKKGNSLEEGKALSLHLKTSSSTISFPFHIHHSYSKCGLSKYMHLVLYLVLTEQQ